MPAHLTATPSSSAPKAPSLKHRLAGTRKPRALRRRRRTQGLVETDDEVERELGSDTESDSDGSSVNSTTDSDTEPASEDVKPNEHAVSESFLPESDPSSKTGKDGTSFFNTGESWSEMVDEGLNGSSELPVIDFKDFNGHTNAIDHSKVSRSRKVQKSDKRSVSTPPSSTPAPALSEPKEHQERLDELELTASTSLREASDRASPSSHRPTGQSARQAYQSRLEADPSFVPKVGEFWGHDDRLLDKDLRCLSGWWRGRWQGGRGRGGFDRRLPARGRGGFSGPRHPGPTNVELGGGDGGDNNDNARMDMPEVPPIERAWTHDGFEEMKRKEDRRRTQREQEQPQRSLQSPRGRGGPVLRRGRAFPRSAGFVPATRSTPFVPTPGKSWFLAKPEAPWTKHLESFLHFDPAFKPHYGKGQTLRLKLPGQQLKTVRASALPASESPADPSKPPSSISGPDAVDRLLVVKLPKRAGMGEDQAVVHQPDESGWISGEPVTTVEDISIDEVFKVRPSIAPRNEPIPQPDDASTSDAVPERCPASPSESQESSKRSSALPDQSIVEQLGNLSLEPRGELEDPSRFLLTEKAILRDASPGEVEQSTSGSGVQPHLSPLRTAFTPPIPQPSPSFASPYSYAPLPPGVGLSQHGVPYEIATGRPVYLQHSPHPMYDPRAMMVPPPPPLGVPFVPGHMHHHSLSIPHSHPHSHSHSHSTSSMDFMQPPPPAQMGAFVDPSTGTPIFSFPRQSSRIEIRAPEDSSEVRLRPPINGSSSLRTGAVAFEPGSSQHVTDNPYEDRETNGAEKDPSEENPRHPAVDSSSGFTSYQQPYYYPEPYGYPPYVDMSQVPQYPVYPPDPRSQGTVYY